MASGPVTIGLVHGGGQGVYEEAAKALQLLRFVGAEVTYIAVNEAGIDLAPLQHWGSLHPNKFRFWQALRAERGHSSDYQLWSLNENQVVKNTVRNWRGGSSGLHGVDIALHGLGLHGVILAGVPMDNRANQFRGKPWSGFGSFQSAWKHREALPVLQLKCRSMSGWTRELLGLPGPEWLDGLVARPAREA